MLQRTSTGRWRLIYKIDQRWVRNNRDPENIVFGTAGREHDRFIYDDAAFLLTMAMADKALFGFETFADLVPETSSISRNSHFQKPPFPETSSISRNPHFRKPSFPESSLSRNPHTLFPEASFSRPIEVPSQVLTPKCSSVHNLPPCLPRTCHAYQLGRVLLALLPLAPAFDRLFLKCQDE